MNGAMFLEGPKLAAILVVGLLLGCTKEHQRSAPTTYPVTGKVLHADGKPVDAGSVEFIAQGSTPFSAMAEIQPDGSFELATLSDTEKLSGAAEGTYQVIVTAGKLEDHGTTPVTLSKPYTVESKPNHFEIRLEK